MIIALSKNCKIVLFLSVLGKYLCSDESCHVMHRRKVALGADVNAWCDQEVEFEASIVGLIFFAFIQVNIF